jgi:hypothetical protein
MPYAPPHTFLVNTPIDAVEYDENLQALRAYLQTGIVVADIAPSWVDVQHIHPGDYYPVINRNIMPSGVSQALTYNDESTLTLYSLAFGDNWFDEAVGLTSVQIDLEQPAVVLVEYSAWTHSVDDGWSSGSASTHYGEAYFVITDTSDVCKMTMYMPPSGHHKTLETCQHGHFVIELPVGRHHFRAIGYTDVNIIYQTAWSVQVHAFYF